MARLTRRVSFVRFRSMAQKESAHKETVDSMNAEIEKVRREHSDIVTLSRDQVGFGFCLFVRLKIRSKSLFLPPPGP